MRQEDPEVFEATHAKVLALVARGRWSTGCGSTIPTGWPTPPAISSGCASAAPSTSGSRRSSRPASRCATGRSRARSATSSCNDVAALFVDPAGEAALTDCGRSLDPRAVRRSTSREAKLEQASTTFAREVARLGARRRRLDEALAALPVYRTYVEPWSGTVEEADRAAIARPACRTPWPVACAWRSAGHDAFVTRFQQTTPPVMAKGVEDTAFYRYLRLLALNEVGGDPGRFGSSLEAFHARQAERARRFPRGLLVTQTHDTKRSGDARARIGALAGMAEEWVEAVAAGGGSTRRCATARRPTRSRST